MKKNILVSIFSKTLVYLYALFLLIPMYFILITAFKSGGDISMNPLGLPTELKFGNFLEALIKGDIGRCSINSIIVTVSTVALSLFNAIIVTYCIYKLFDRKIGAVVYSLIIGSMFIPSVGMVTMISLYQKLHLYNSLIGLILGGSVSGLAFNLFILLGFFRTVPRELEEAAVIDGCNSMQSLFYVLIPVVKPALVTLAIFAFVSNWNSLMGPLLLLRNSELYTIPIGLLSFRGSYSIEYNLMFASILMTSLPLVILYIKFQKYFIEALSGGIKG